MDKNSGSFQHINRKSLSSMNKERTNKSSNPVGFLFPKNSTVIG